jgi:uncharacterized iron-regulated protein
MLTGQVASRGYSSLTDEERHDLGEIRCDLDEVYEALLRATLEEISHGGMDFQRFCEAQMVWDTAMAVNLLNYLADNPGTSVVVLAGSAHAWKRGIPRQIRNRSEHEFRVVLPEVAGRWAADEASTGDADFLWLEE